jgi:hypothetical protein
MLTVRKVLLLGAEADFDVIKTVHSAQFRPVCRVVDIQQVGICLGALAEREQLIVKLAILAGMRREEISG